MRDSVPSARYSHVCHVLRLWRILLIPTCSLLTLWYHHNNIILCWSCHKYILTPIFCKCTVAMTTKLQGAVCNGVCIYVCACVRVCVCIYIGSSFLLFPPLPLPPLSFYFPPSFLILLLHVCHLNALNVKVPVVGKPLTYEQYVTFAVLTAFPCHVYRVMVRVMKYVIQWNLYIAVTPRKQPSGCYIQVVCL